MEGCYFEEFKYTTCWVIFTVSDWIPCVFRRSFDAFESKLLTGGVYKYTKLSDTRKYRPCLCAAVRWQEDRVCVGSPLCCVRMPGMSVHVGSCLPSWLLGGVRPSNQPRCPVTKPEHKIEVSSDSRNGGSAQKPSLPPFCRSDTVSPSAAQKKEAVAKHKRSCNVFPLGANSRRPESREKSSALSRQQLAQQHWAFSFGQIENLHLFCYILIFFFFYYY